MKLHRLRIQNFATIEQLDVELGPGLNVLYGPNDLGKSTAATAIRLGLLLPHNSAYCEQYVGWTSRGDPVVEITFESGAQRIWRVRKQFGKSGSSLLQESRNGQDFDDLERGRKVDATLREILGWGIPEPGGAGGAKGLPSSFLATVLLSTQDDVSAALSSSLDGDAIGSGKDRIAAALQAVAQDPLFLLLLKESQARRDAAYTDKGSKKTAKGTVFKEAAERVKQTREEKEKLEHIVADSESVEQQLYELTHRRSQKQEELADANHLVENLATSVAQAESLALAAEQVRLARSEVLRVQSIRNQAEEAERALTAFAQKIDEVGQKVSIANRLKLEEEAALKAAEEAARAEETDPGMADTVARQELELRKSASERAAGEAQQRIDAAAAAQKVVDALVDAEREFHERQEQAKLATEATLKATAKSESIEEQLQHCDLLELALDVFAANKQVQNAQAAVEKETRLRNRLEDASREHSLLAAKRAPLIVPPSSSIGALRKLARELDTALAALDVGFVVTINPKTRIDLTIRKDGEQRDSLSTTTPVDIEANAEVELSIGEIAAISVRGGRRISQEKAQDLRDRWKREIEPHLTAAGVSDLDGLETKIAEVQELDAGMRAKVSEMDSLQTQIAELAGSAENFREVSKRLEACHALLGDVRLESLTAEIEVLGTDAVTGLRSRRKQLSEEAEAARALGKQATSNQTLADERTRTARSALDAARAAHDVGLLAFPQGVDAALTAAQAALASINSEKEKITNQLTSLERTIDQRKQRVDAALIVARHKVEQAKLTVDAAQAQLTAARDHHSTQQGRLDELRKQRDAENLVAAETSLSQVIQRHAGLPVPNRNVAEQEVNLARTDAARVKSELENIEREIQKTHGALEQVGGAVARERLRDATEAFELAEHQEKEVEAEYEAWKLLLEQMKEADAAQASNLGQALVPAIAARFQELTEGRYQTVSLTAQLATEGVVVSGSVKLVERISVGTREQLSTLYRLALAEYLRTVIVLDDQLVQSDNTRMDWFRKLLTEKAQLFQIIVFTCRPDDYLLSNVLVPAGEDAYIDTNDGLIRSIDMARALRKR